MGKTDIREYQYFGQLLARKRAGDAPILAYRSTWQPIGDWQLSRGRFEILEAE